MDDFKFVRCPNCGWEKNPRKPCFNCGDKKPPAPSKTSNGTELATAQERIAELEKALEPFAREEIGTMYKDPWHLQFSDPDGFVDFTDFTIGDLRRAAALLEKK